MAIGDTVTTQSAKKWPTEYHCTCEYCKVRIGELRPNDGSYYSRLERRSYYDAIERGPGGHIAKTPLHVARWAVQQYSKPRQWVLDPTAGAGTTAVEALTQGRYFAGMELEFGEVIRANIQKHVAGREAHLRIGDARQISAFLKEKLPKKKFALVVNNPPYSGDESMPAPTVRSKGNKEFRHEERKFKYSDDLPNLAFLKEREEYWDTIASIYKSCAQVLAPGGHFVIGVKDMVSASQYVLLHKMYSDVLRDRVGLQFVGTAILPHYPRTFRMNVDAKRGHPSALYQTINVFRKE